jgi:hypothetical protein
MALEVIALLVSTGALIVSIGAIVWQSKQGERIGVSVISTVDQIYRHLKTGQRHDESLDELLDESLDVEWFAEVSAKYVKRGGRVNLSIEGWPTAHIVGVPWEIRCVVEDALGRVLHVVKNVESNSIKTSDSVECEAVFPDEFDDGSTNDPGRYHVWWQGREAVEMEGRRPSWRLLAEHSFGVLP